MPAPKASNTQLQQDEKMLNQMTDSVNVFISKVNKLTGDISPNNTTNIGGISPGHLGRFLDLHESFKADITSLQTTVSQLTSSQSHAVAQSAQTLMLKLNEMQQSLNGVLAQIERYNQMNLRQPGATRQHTQTSPSPQRLQNLLQSGPQLGTDAVSQKMREIHQQQQQKRTPSSSPQKPPITRGNNQSAAISAKVQAGSKGKKYFTDLSIEEKVKEIQKMQRAKNIKDKLPTVPSHKPK